MFAAMICLVSSVYAYIDLGSHWNPEYGTDEP